MSGAAGSGLTRAEALATAPLVLLASMVTLPYLTDLLGVGIAARGTATAALLLAIAAGVSGWRVAERARTAPDLLLYLATICIAGAYFLSQAWPALLPPGSGPDLTHHLLLVDYIERHGTLVHDPDAGGALGEMAFYTPGLHLLAVLTGAVTGSSGFLTIYTVVAIATALKFGLFALILLRLLREVPARLGLAAAGVALLFALPAHTIDSFTRDSFLAQVVSELFAVAMFWSLVAWAQQPASRPAAMFAIAGVAAFLTWPVWIGPPLLALAAIVLFRHIMPAGVRLRHFGLAAFPIVAVAAVYAAGRVAAAGIVGTSGAVEQGALVSSAWWLVVLSIPGLVLAGRRPGGQAVVALVAGLLLQAIALWTAARLRGASTPYMAIKMAYLAVYPLSAAALVGLAVLFARSRAAVAAVMVIAISVGGYRLLERERPVPVVNVDLWNAGLWARRHLPVAEIDYLVADEYTAYWLHLAVLGNPRAERRSMDDNTYLTEPSFARWVGDGHAPRYAIARSSALPAEIRDRTRVLQRYGDAVVLERAPAR